MSRPTVWQALSWVLSLVVTAVAAHEGTKAMTSPPAQVSRPAGPPADNGSVERLAAGGKESVDRFEEMAKQVVQDARSKLKQ